MEAFLYEGLTPKDEIVFAKAFQVSLQLLGKDSCWCMKKCKDNIFSGFTTSKKGFLSYKGRDARPLLLAMAGKTFEPQKPIVVRKSCCKSTYCLNPSHYYWGTRADVAYETTKKNKTGLDSAQKELASAIENADAASQIEAQKKIAALSIDEARLNALKEQQSTTKEVSAPKLSDANTLPESTPQSLPTPDPKAEDWASNNSWFGKDRAMTFTAFEIHKDLVEREGFDPQTDEYYAEVDKRIRVEFPHKFDTKETQTSKPTQNVASVKRSAVRQGKQTVRLTSSQVAIAKKLGVPLEEYAKQIKLTEGA